MTDTTKHIITGGVTLLLSLLIRFTDTPVTINFHQHEEVQPAATVPIQLVPEGEVGSTTSPSETIIQKLKEPTLAKIPQGKWQNKIRIDDTSLFDRHQNLVTIHGEIMFDPDGHIIGIAGTDDIEPTPIESSTSDEQLAQE